MYRCDKKERIGGGVAIWVKDSIESRERGDIKEGINVEDSVWVEIRDMYCLFMQSGDYNGLVVHRIGG